MSVAVAVVTAVVFVWLGMVLAISFLEAPLKFRAPGVTIPIGLGIGRVVFRALNTAEVALSVILAVLVVVGLPSTTGVIALLVAVATLVLQLAAVRPRLTRRSDRVLAGDAVPRSRGHHVYVGLELIKVAALVAAGVAMLAA